MRSAGVASDQCQGYSPHHVANMWRHNTSDTVFEPLVTRVVTTTSAPIWSVFDSQEVIFRGNALLITVSSRCNSPTKEDLTTGTGPSPHESFIFNHIIPPQIIAVLIQ